MKLRNQCTIEARREQVWRLLGDLAQVALCIPGVESVHALGDGSWGGVLKVRVGPISVNLEGKLRLQEQDNGAYRLVLAIEGREQRIGGAVRGVLSVTLGEGVQGRTDLVVDADLNLMGRLGQLGQPVIRHRADEVLRQFAQNVGRRASQATAS